MSNIIDSIRMSGTTYAISDSGGTKVVEITQSDYDNLPTSAKTANIMYVITDAEPFDVSNYYTKAETSGATELATAFAATQPKLSAGTNITIDANNVISAEGGSGKAVVGGRGITVTTGATADTVSFSLPISAGTGSNSVIEGDYANKATGSYSHAEGGTTSATTNYAHAEGMKTKAAGQSSHAEGERTTATTHYSHTEGYFTIANNKSEHASGQYNVSNKIDTTFGHSGNTLFSVGNGTDTTARHNAFEIRQNGDIYITSGNTDIKLQDHLGGGGGGGIDSGTVQTMIDQSISGKTNQTDFVSHSGNTSIHVTTAQTAAWDAKSDFSGSYNDLTNKLSAGTNITIVDNVISAESGGGGKAVSGGTNISITSGETVDTINCTLPISADSKGIYTTSTYPFLSTSNKSGNVVFGYNNRLDTFGSSKNSNNNLFFGSDNYMSVNGSGMLIGGLNNKNSGNYTNMTACVALGNSNIVGNPYEFASGCFNQTYYNSTSFGLSGNTLFSVGNGLSNTSRHSAFEIRQNGDIYIADTNDTSTTNWYQKPMVRLQDTITALGGLKLVKLTQSEYDNLSTKDNSTLYVIVN